MQALFQLFCRYTHSLVLANEQLHLEASIIEQIPTSKVSDYIISGFYNQIYNIINTENLNKQKKIIFKKENQD